MMERKKNLGIDLESTGKRIRNAMKRKSYTAKDVATMMGLSYQSVWKWCKGEAIPDVENLLILSRILEVQMDNLVVTLDSLDRRIDELLVTDFVWEKAVDSLPGERLTEESVASDYIVGVEKVKHYVVVNKITSHGIQRRLLRCWKKIS